MGTSWTFIPDGPYHPIFIAIANGAAAEVMVRAQKPTLTVSPAASALDANATRIATMPFFIGCSPSLDAPAFGLRPSQAKPAPPEGRPMRTSGTDPRRGPGGEPGPRLR